LTSFWRRAALIALFVAAGALLADPPSCARPLEWRSDLDAALAEARAGARPAAVSFWAAWCSVCRRFDRATLERAEVARELDRFVRVRVDVTRRSAENEALMARFGVGALPALVLVDSHGEIARELSSAGFRSPGELIPRLRALR
jgi:thiol:disulfide interchange protein DsbD